MSTPKEILEQKIPEKLKAKPDKVKTVNALVNFDISGPTGGQWTLDCTSADACVKAGNDPAAKVTVLMTDSDFVSLIDGKLNAQMAFLTGKLKVKGDMGTALKLGNIL
ncbi:MAG: sterol-binding protein [Deltaproteobacteria bacterium CG11_big_fil_rev_8_21_14_0_20_47_16]|nr:MAG: sterol-binding protein [Deltaproteobacteria bacterium CG11_big_fil_rev_8_21_14_0_20_47_16]